jgi:hypothetical protein
VIAPTARTLESNTDTVCFMIFSPVKPRFARGGDDNDFLCPATRDLTQVPCVAKIECEHRIDAH